MKGRIFELEEQVKDINYLEGKNKELLNDNLALLQLKIEAEYVLNSFQERHKLIFDNLKEEIALLQDDNEKKRNINTALYEQNIIFKSENKKLLDDLREQHEVIKELQRQKTQFELTIHNISKTLIETRDENEKLLKQNNIRSTLNKQYSIKRYEQWDYSNNSRYHNSSCDISNDRDNDRLIEENAKLKRYILLIANHNQKLCKDIDRTLRNKNDYILIDSIKEENKRVMIDIINQIEEVTVKKPNENLYNGNKNASPDM